MRADSSWPALGRLAQGLIALAFGLGTFFAPRLGLVTATLIAGLVLTLEGFVAATEAVLATRNGRTDRLLLGGGIASVGAGIFLLLNPLLAMRMLSYLVALGMVGAGVFALLCFFRREAWTLGSWAEASGAALCCALGAYLLTELPRPAAFLAPLIGGAALFWGGVMVSHALSSLNPRTLGTAR